jgi:hypothetical protein
VASSGTGGVITNVTAYSNAQAAIGFIAADAFDGQRATLNSLAFASLGQTQALLLGLGSGGRRPAATCATGTTRSGLRAHDRAADER